MNHFNTSLLGTVQPKPSVFTHQLIGNAVGVVLLAVVFSLLGSESQQPTQASSIAYELNCNYEANRTSFAFGCKP